MKVAVVNVHSTRNAGDAILLEMTLHLLKQKYPNADITLVSNDVKSVGAQQQVVGSFATWLKNFDEDSNRWRPLGLLLLPLYALILLVASLGHRLTNRLIPLPLLKSQRTLLKVYAEADLIVSVAGNFLYSSGRIGLPYMLAILGMGFGIWLKKPVIMFPQTLGPIQGRRDARMLRWLLKRLTLIFLRDAHSLKVVQQCNASTTHCHVVPDIAFGYPSAKNKSGVELLQSYGVKVDDNRPKLGVTTINWGGLSTQFNNQAQYELIIAQTIRYFIETMQGQVVLFSQVQGPTQVEDDRKTAAKIFALLPDLHHSLVFIARECAPDVLKSAYQSMDIFVGTRLHSNIFALSVEVPVVAIAYQPKTRGTMKIIELEDWVIDIDQLTNQNLSEMVQRLWQQKDLIKTQLQTTLPQIRQQIDAISEQLPN